MMAETRTKGRPRSTITYAYFTYVVVFGWIVTAVLSEELPEFLEQPQSQVIHRGTPVTLKCSATPEEAHIRWLFDGQPLDQRRHSGLQVVGSNLLFFHHHNQHAAVDDSNEGEYRCTATTSLGTVISRPALLSKPILTRFTPVDDVAIVVREGGYVTLTCDPPRSSPPARVVFQRGIRDLEDNMEGTVHRLPSGNLILSNVTSASSGDFRCVAVNPISGENRTSLGVISLLVDKSLSGQLPSVHVMPGVRHRLQPEIGTDVTLECPSYGHRAAKITWSKYGASLPIGRFNLLEFGQLQILSVQYEDSGTYNCRSDADSRAVGQVSLEVLIPPVVQVVKQPGPAAILAGSRVEMTCSVAGFPKPELHWFHNGHELTNNNGAASLVLTTVSSVHTGIYQCMATNRIGTAYGVMRLEVESQSGAMPEVGGQLERVETPADNLQIEDDEDVGMSSGFGRPDDQRKKAGRRDRKKHGRRKKIQMNERRKKNGQGGPPGKDKPKYAPSVPTVAQLSDRSVMLNWSVPDRGNGQTIKFFKVQFKEMNPEKGPWRTSDAHLPFNARRFEVADLKSGGSYKFRILAVYEDDDNKNSANTPIFRLLVQPHAQARSPDTAPTIVEAKPIVYQQNFGIGVKWQYKTETASPIEGFIIFYKPFGASEDKEKIIPGAGIRNDVIRDLLPNTPYNIRMQSFNSVGRSQFSNQVVKTTKVRDSSIAEDYIEIEIPPRESEASTDTPVSGRRNSETLENPVILGVVLGALLLALLILITMCWWKQRQQKRRSLAGNSQLKFQDQSHCIFADSSHTKPNGGLYPANVSAPVANGHGPHLKAHKHMNMDASPLGDYDMQTAVPGDSRAMLFYGSGINSTASRLTPDTGCGGENIFQHMGGGGNNLRGCNGDIPYMLQQQQHPCSMQHRTLPHTPNTFYTELSTASLTTSHEYSEPADRELQSPGASHSLCKQNLDYHGNSMGHVRNLDYAWPGSYDHPRVGSPHFSPGERLSPLYSVTSVDFSGKPGFYQHNSHPLPSLPSPPAPQVLMSDYGPDPGCAGSSNPGLLGGGRHKRRRKRAHGQGPAPREHAVRDQATNTDLSSNEGTLEFVTYKSGSSSNSGSEAGGQNCDSSFANNGSVESDDDSHSSASHEPSLGTMTDMPAPL